MNKIVMVLSAADTWTRADGTQYATGYWAEDLVVIHDKLVKAGCAVDIATPEGRTPTVDPRSISPILVASEAMRFANYLMAISASLESPLKLSEVNIENYDAMVIPGGHGPVEDLHKDSAMGRLLFAAESAGKIIASVCHGPAALLSATDSEGKWLFAGRRMTAFSDDEEVEFGTEDNAPWLLADRLRHSGARYECGPNWRSFVVQDGNLISGQNPASSRAVADAILTTHARRSSTPPISLRPQHTPRQRPSPQASRH
jgi:putative intracellular protease/amidase